MEPLSHSAAPSQRRGRFESTLQPANAMSSSANLLEGEDPAVRQCLLDPTRPLAAPVATVKEKWRLLPAFLKVRGLVNQHLASYNHLVNVEMREIVQANSYLTVNNQPNFYLKFLDVRVGEPSSEEMMGEDRTWANGSYSPQECRLRDMSYSAPIKVDIEYTLGQRKLIKRDVVVGRMPIMLKSSKCILHGVSDEMLARMGECPCDPGGYFVVKGSEKVILVQEQLSKNRVIVDRDPKGQIRAAVTSSTVDRKSKTYVVAHKGNYMLRHNSCRHALAISAGHHHAHPSAPPLFYTPPSSALAPPSRTPSALAPPSRTPSALALPPMHAPAPAVELAIDLPRGAVRTSRS